MAQYLNGETVKVGDQVVFMTWKGTIVFVLDDEQFSESFPAADWLYLKEEGAIFGLVRDDKELIVGRSLGELEKI